jgi:hypothetical protein
LQCSSCASTPNKNNKLIHRFSSGEAIESLRRVVGPDQGNKSMMQPGSAVVYVGFWNRPGGKPPPVGRFADLDLLAGSIRMRYQDHYQRKSGSVHRIHHSDNSWLRQGGRPVDKGCPGSRGAVHSILKGRSAGMPSAHYQHSRPCSFSNKPVVSTLSHESTEYAGATRVAMKPDTDSIA